MVNAFGNEEDVEVKWQVSQWLPGVAGKRNQGCKGLQAFERWKATIIIVFAQNLLDFMVQKTLLCLSSTLRAQELEVKQQMDCL